MPEQPDLKELKNLKEELQALKAELQTDLARLKTEHQDVAALKTAVEETAPSASGDARLTLWTLDRLAGVDARLEQCLPKTSLDVAMLEGLPRALREYAGFRWKRVTAFLCVLGLIGLSATTLLGNVVKRLFQDDFDKVVKKAEADTANVKTRMEVTMSVATDYVETAAKGYGEQLRKVGDQQRELERQRKRIEEQQKKADGSLREVVQSIDGLRGKLGEISNEDLVKTIKAANLALGEGGALSQLAEAASSLQELEAKLTWKPVNLTTEDAYRRAYLRELGESQGEGLVLIKAEGEGKVETHLWLVSRYAEAAFAVPLVSGASRSGGRSVGSTNLATSWRKDTNGSLLSLDAVLIRVPEESKPDWTVSAFRRRFRDKQ